jgi:branched-chain amino acid transport system permease protein
MVLALVLFSTLTQAWLLYLGLLFMAMVMFAPGGVAGGLQGLGAALQRARTDATPPHRLAARLLARWARATPLVVAAAGCTALVEMAYHRQLNAALGPQLQWLGLTLDTGRPLHWLAAAAWVATALALAWVLRRRPRQVPAAQGQPAP